MLSTAPEALGPDDSDRIQQMLHWCEVIRWMGQNYADEYLAGDLRTSFAIYHAIGLLADIARQTDDAILQEMPGIDWAGLVGMGVMLVHVPWQVQTRLVWRAVVESVPALRAELMRYAADNSG